MTKLLVKESYLHGNGIFSIKKYNAGETIALITGNRHFYDVRNYGDAISNPDWIGIGDRHWVDPEPPIKFLNHSCKPNAGIVANEEGTIFLVATKEITEDEEITIDYSTTESEPLWEMTCNCKSQSCRQKIGPVTTIPENVFLNYLPYVQKYFQEVYKNSR